MVNRFKLLSGLQRKYLLKTEVASGFTGDVLAKTLGVVGRSYRDWKREKYPITQKAAEIIENRYGIVFPYSKVNALNKWRRSKTEAARKGGLALAKKYGGPGTLEGRIKGGKHAMSILRAKGILPRIKPFKLSDKYSPELAEFVGILLGDGHLGNGQWTVSLNAVKDRRYGQFVVELVNNLFGFRPSVYRRKDSKVLIICGSGIRAIEYFKKIGLKTGDKVKQQVVVPNWIVNDDIFRLRCLRGLTDTDGGIFIHRYKVKGKVYSYKKLSFVNRSVPLLNFVYETLSRFGFNPKKVMAVENKRVWLYNQHEVNEYLNKVGSSNPRLLRHFIGGLPER